MYEHFTQLTDALLTPAAMPKRRASHLCCLSRSSFPGFGLFDFANGSFPASRSRRRRSTVVPVPMVHIGIMRMAVGQPLMHVGVCVRLSAIPRKIVRVLMMLVMRMAM